MKALLKSAHMSVSAMALMAGIGLLIASTPQSVIAGPGSCPEQCGGVDHPECPDIPTDSIWLCCGDESDGTWYYNAATGP